ncbi:MAG: hypothetical protein EOP09_00145 [Proteobacteria bacterium]|nr:MAG: hypothetical protein EOP09_00145 [Pseudomonadota bacterium]
MKEQDDTQQAMDQSPANYQPRKTIGLARTTVAYWREKVEQVIGRGGRLSPNFSARIFYQKENGRFPLATPNKEAAAKKAAQIFQFLIDNGWEATRRKFKPHTLKEESSNLMDTVGALIVAASSISSARPQSKDTYIKAFRRIVAEIEGFGDGRNRSSNTLAEWKMKVDGVKLAAITPAKVLEWKIAFIAKAGTAPLQRRSAKTTCNSLLRNSKALFARKTLRFLKEKVQLPSPLPFDEIPMEKQESMRYQSKINAAKIIEKAVEELSDQPEVFKAFLLSLLFGLRVSEMDHLLWSAFDFEKGVLVAQSTEYHELKSHDSGGEIEMKPETLAVLRGYRAKATSIFVLEPPSPKRIRSGASRSYRCRKIFDTLRGWLRTQGVPSKKPIHELRKEIGSIMADEYGVWAASRFLRHSDIRITTSVYLDKKSRTAPSIGSLIRSGENIVKLPLLSPISSDGSSSEFQKEALQ